jgi:hypothetical protein
MPNNNPDPRTEGQRVVDALNTFNEKITGLSGDGDVITDLLERVAACKELKDLLDKANEARKQRYSGN